MDQTLARCLNDDAYLQLPLSRSLRNYADQIDWVRSTWGWSLVAPKPEWVPAAMFAYFPGWAAEDVDWLALLPTPAKDATLQAPQFRRLVDVIDTAVVVADRAGFTQNSAQDLLVALIGLLRTVRGRVHVQPIWWESIAQDTWACDVLGCALVNLRPEIQRELASSLLEICAKVFLTDASWKVFGLMYSQLWMRLLDVEDAAELWGMLTPAAKVFIARNIQSVPWPLRKAAVEQIDPELLTHTFDWRTLFCETTAPNKERIDQLLSFRPYQFVDALWSVHPNLCLELTTKSPSPYSALFAYQCPPEKLGELAAILVRTPALVKELDIQPGWVASRIASAKASTPVLLELLSLALSVTPID